MFSVRSLILCLAFLFTGCVAQVRGTRLQKPFNVAPAGTQIAFLGVDVPAWMPVNERLGDPGGLMRQAILDAFKKSSLEVVDRTGTARFQLGPDTAPQILQTAPTGAEVGQAWPMVAMAVGKPPITWRLLEGPPTLTVNAESGQINWTPAATGLEKIVLEATNARGSTRQVLTVDVQKAGWGGVKPRSPSMPVIAPDQTYAAQRPATAPAEPLWLGATVVGWNVGSIAMPGGSARPTFTVDVAYTVWTRSGREVETRRVQVNGVPAAPYSERIKTYPPRSSWTSPNEDAELRSRFASLKEDMLPVETAQMNADVFAYTFGEHQRWFSAQLDESSPLLKPGIELSNKDDFEGAYKTFSELAASNPQLPGAFFNMGVMCEVLGRDEEASELYKKARGLDAKEGMYVRQQEALEARLKYRKAIAFD
ncbi:MAG: tetratricopeptide repeat protein [Myxococcales bacterium]|nr:tetratricopeptide repeat protein [Myxococcales bacterium]